MSKINTCRTCGTMHSKNGDFCSATCEASFHDKLTGKVEVDGGGMRFNSNKLAVELVPTGAVYSMAGALGYGASKYEPHNWRRGMKWTIPYACAMRHLLKWFDGEDLDEESGQEHLGHVMANIAMLIEYKKTCPDLDDRFKGVSRTYDDFKTEGAKTVGVPITEEDLQLMADEWDSKL